MADECCMCEHAKADHYNGRGGCNHRVALGWCGCTEYVPKQEERER